MQNPVPKGTGEFGTTDVASSSGTGHVGTRSLIWYSNDGASDPSKRCGQAVATMLRLGGLTMDNCYKIVHALNAQWPTDGHGPLQLGTNWRRIQTMLQANGLKVHAVQGVPAINQEIANGNPMIVMLDADKCPEWNYECDVALGGMIPGRCKGRSGLSASGPLRAVCVRAAQDCLGTR